MVLYIAHTCKSFPHCEWSCASSNLHLVQMICRIEHICATSLQCEPAYDDVTYWHEEMNWDTWCMDVCWPFLLLNFPTCVHELISETEDQGSSRHFNYVVTLSLSHKYYSDVTMIRQKGVLQTYVEIISKLGQTRWTGEEIRNTKHQNVANTLWEEFSVVTLSVLTKPNEQMTTSETSF